MVSGSSEPPLPRPSFVQMKKCELTYINPSALCCSCELSKISIPVIISEHVQMGCAQIISRIIRDYV